MVSAHDNAILASACARQNRLIRVVVVVVVVVQDNF